MTTIYQDGLVPGNMQVSLGGQIVNSGTGGGAVDSTVGVAFTAEKLAGTGAYQITLADPYPQVWAVTASIQTATNERIVTVTAITAATSTANNKIGFQVYDNDPAGAAQNLLNESLHFHLTLVRSNAQ